MKSLPSATASMWVASATAAPPLEPPADFVASNALRVTPNTSLKVCEPRPNSGVLVLPTTMQPAAFMRVTMSASWAGRLSARSGEPSVVGMPCVSAASLIACGMPCIQPRFSPRERGVAGIGLAQETDLVLEADDGIDAGVHRGDAIEVRTHHVAARSFAGVESTRERVGVEVGEVHGCRVLARAEHHLPRDGRAH